MEIVFGIVTTCIMEIIKWLSNKLGKTMTEGLIVGGVFFLVLLWTVLTQAHIISEQTVEFIIKVFAISTATYVVVIKKIAPFLQKLIAM